MSVILHQHPKAFRSIPTARHLSHHFSLHGHPIPTACRLLDCSLVHSLSLPPRTPASLSCLPACLFARSTPPASMLACSLSLPPCSPPRLPAGCICLLACPLTLPASPLAHFTLLVAAHSPCLTCPFHFPCCPLTFPATPLARFSFPVAAHSPCFLPRPLHSPVACSLSPPRRSPTSLSLLPLTLLASSLARSTFPVVCSLSPPRRSPISLSLSPLTPCIATCPFHFPCCLLTLPRCLPISPSLSPAHSAACQSILTSPILLSIM